MKILYLITKSNFGGAQRYVYDLATSLSSRDFDIAVAFGGHDTLETKLNEAKIKTISVQSLNRDINLFNDLRVFREIISILKTERPDIVHLNSSKMGLLGSLAARTYDLSQKLSTFNFSLSTCKVIFTAHGWAFNEDRNIFAKYAILALHWLTVLLTNTTIAVSQQTADQIKSLPFTKNKIKTIHNGIDVFGLKGGFEARQIIASNIQEDIWIGTISELHKNKGLDYLITAFATLNEDFPDTALIIIGDGEEKQNLQNLIVKKNLQGKVHLVGRIDNARAYLKALDIFALTSRTEAFPYVLLEAGTAGLPVVASAVGGIPEIIIPEQTGILVRPRQPKEIYISLTNILQSPELKENLGKRLQEKVTTEFTINKMIEKTLEVYKQSLSSSYLRMQ